MTRLRHVVVPLVVATMAATPVTAGPSADGCERSGANVQITLSSTGVARLGPGGAFEVFLNGVQQDCEGATNESTQFVDVLGTGQRDRFLIDQNGTGGRFRVEVIWRVDLGEGNDLIQLRGTPKADRYNIGTWQVGNTLVDVIDTDGDGTPNIDLFGTERMMRLQSGGNDVVSGMPKPGTNRSTGSGATMGPARIPLTLKGGPGKDRLTGGNAGDLLVGGAKDDTLKGGKGKDTLKGGGGNDRCKGGPGKDKERGCE